MIKKFLIVVLVIAINLNLLGCDANKSILEKKNILNNDDIKVLASMVLRYQNKDGGFYQYYDDETSLYSTFRNINILSKNEMLSDELAENAKEWMKNINSNFFVNDKIYMILNNIYYYLEIAKLVDYDIPLETKNLIQNRLKELYDGHNFKLSTTLQTDDTKLYEGIKILANSEGVCIFKLLNNKLENKDELVNWYNNLIDNSTSNDNISLGHIRAVIQGLAELDTKPISKNDKIYEILMNYEIQSDASFIDIYNVFIINKYLIEEVYMDYWLLNYEKYLIEFQKNGVFITKEMAGGNALFTDLAVDMTTLLDIKFDWSKEVDEIYQNQLSNGSFNDSIIMESDLIDTIYAFKLLDILGFDSVELENAKKYIKENQENYNTFNDYEKILYLRMKYDLHISAQDDEKKVSNLLKVAYNHSIEKNYILVIPLLELCNDFKVPVDEEYLKKINSFVNITDNNTIDLTEEEFVLMLYKYQLARAAMLPDDNNLRKKIIEGYRDNFLNYENQQQLLELILTANIPVSPDEDNNQLFNEAFKRTKFIIEHKKLEDEGGGNISFYDLYMTLLILKYKN